MEPTKQTLEKEKMSLENIHELISIIGNEALNKIADRANQYFNFTESKLSFALSVLSSSLITLLDEISTRCNKGTFDNMLEEMIQAVEKIKNNNKDK